MVLMDGNPYSQHSAVVNTSCPIDKVRNSWKEYVILETSDTDEEAENMRINGVNDLEFSGRNYPNVQNHAVLFSGFEKFLKIIAKKAKTESDIKRVNIRLIDNDNGREHYDIVLFLTSVNDDDNNDNNQEPYFLLSIIDTTRDVICETSKIATNETLWSATNLSNTNDQIRTACYLGFIQLMLNKYDEWFKGYNRPYAADESLDIADVANFFENTDTDNNNINNNDFPQNRPGQELEYPPMNSPRMPTNLNDDNEMPLHDISLNDMQEYGNPNNYPFGESNYPFGESEPTEEIESEPAEKPLLKNFEELFN